MKNVFKVTVFLLLALWLPATNHCDFEAADVAGCADEEHSPLACGDTCERDVCSIIEGEAYSRSVDARKILIPAQSPGFCLANLPVLSVDAAPAPVLITGDPPELQGLHRTWAFVRRAAALACAPNEVA